VAALLAGFDGARIKADVARLASFGTRHTLSDTTSETRGIGAAQRWIEAELRRSALESGRTGEETMQVVAEPHLVHADGKRLSRDVQVVDVVATLPGTSPTARARRYYAVAHYDSRCSEPMDATSDAPGANDDASGVAVLLALARALGKARFDATIVLLATAGEEQGLFGAKEHVAALGGADVRAVLNNDIVGDPADGDAHALRVFSEGVPAKTDTEHAAQVRFLALENDSSSRELARFVAETAASERLELAPMLVQRADRILRGGDHLPFNDAGIAAVRLTASGEDYTRQHQNVRAESGVAYGDVAERVDAAYLAGVARVNAAALVHLASAPEPPPEARLVAELSRDTFVRWTPSRDAHVAGYEVVWRTTASPTWEHARDVGRGTEARLPLSKDDLFFGVRAYDARGYRSPVAFARPAPP
jgi:hypothetical protein